jgi:hypothetical protein
MALQLPPQTRRPRPTASGSSAHRAEQRARVLHPATGPIRLTKGPRLRGAPCRFPSL